MSDPLYVQAGPLKEVLSELFTLLEAQETNAAAILQLLRDQEFAADEKMGPYLEQAGKASNIKWLAARRRMEYLLTPIGKEAAEEKRDQTKDQTKEPGKKQAELAQAEALAEKPAQQENAPEREGAERPAAKGESTTSETAADSTKSNVKQEATGTAKTDGSGDSAARQSA